MASKTGTSDNGKGGIPDSWIMAYNPDIVVGVWVGNTAPNGGGGLIRAFGESVGLTIMARFVNNLPPTMQRLVQAAARDRDGCGARPRKSFLQGNPGLHPGAHAVDEPRRPARRRAGRLLPPPSLPVRLRPRPPPAPSPPPRLSSPTPPPRPGTTAGGRAPDPSPSPEHMERPERQPVHAERRQTAAGHSMRGYVTRTLPHSSVIVVEQPRPPRAAP